MKLKLGGKGILAAVPEKNTFIHYDLPNENEDDLSSAPSSLEPPTVSAPAVLQSAIALIPGTTMVGGTTSPQCPAVAQQSLMDIFDTRSVPISVPPMLKQRNSSL